MENSHLEVSSDYSPLDELCVRMLSLGAMGGCDGGTNNLRGSEIKALLIPFFGMTRVQRCSRVLCGETAPET